MKKKKTTSYRLQAIERPGEKRVTKSTENRMQKNTIRNRCRDRVRARRTCVRNSRADCSTRRAGRRPWRPSTASSSPGACRSARLSLRRTRCPSHDSAPPQIPSQNHTTTIINIKH